MTELKNQLRNVISETIKKMAGSDDIAEKDIIVEVPPRPEMGDVAFPMFPYARLLKKPPHLIAAEAARTASEIDPAGRYTAEGPYVNVFAERKSFTARTIGAVLEGKERYGSNLSRKNEKIMVEFSCPNTNKPLHLGHLRNDSIGESISRILEYNGAQVLKVNLINDRGIHICKSMLAYSEFGNGSTPESENLKSDHFVGKYYVEYDKWSKKAPEAEAKAREMLVEWENSNPDVRLLWERMNKWAIDGIKETYAKTGVTFDKIYYESQTYSSGKDEVLRGLDKGVFYRDENNTVWVDLEDINLDRKVLLRGDGTSLYLTQDIGTAIARHNDWPFDTLIYVVASEQQYHFRVLFHILEKLGYEWARNLYHLSYGMVNLPEGKMKSREGKVVDADDLIEELSSLAENEIKSKERENDVKDVRQTASSIALGALNYFLLSPSPLKDMVFNPAESLSFNGNTGPYLQYMGARISSILQKYGKETDYSRVDFEKITDDDDWELVKALAGFPQAVKEAGDNLNPSVLANYIYELARSFSKYYHDNPVLNNEDNSVTDARVVLCRAVRQVFRNCFELLGIPYLSSM